MKRWIAAALVPVLLLLPGCASKQANSLLDPANPVTLSLWHYYSDENQKSLENAVSAFNQTVGIERGVIIDPIAKGRIVELEAAVTEAAIGVINSEPMPDMFSSYPDKAIEIDRLGKLCDLTDYFTEEEKKKYIQGFLADGVDENGRLLVLPVAKSTDLLFVNATVWQSFARSEGFTQEKLSDWSGIYETARAYYAWTDLRTPDVPWDGKSFLGFDSLSNFILISAKQLNVDIIDAENKQAVLDKNALRQIFDIYYNGICLGYLGGGGSFGSDNIKKGILAAYVGSSSSAAHFPTWVEENNTQVPIDLLTLPLPMIVTGHPYTYQQGAGISMAKSTPARQEGAALFLKWFTDAGQNIDFALTTGYLPVQRAAYESERLSAALKKLRGGDAGKQNVAGVYEIAKHQILVSDTYAPKPFDGSYSVRRILQTSLLKLAQEGKVLAAPLKEQGLSEEEILQTIDTNAQFEAWLETMRRQFAEKNIAYIDR